MTLDALRSLAAAVLFVAGLMLWTRASMHVESNAGSPGTVASCEESEVDAAHPDVEPPAAQGECPPTDAFALMLRSGWHTVDCSTLGRWVNPRSKASSSSSR